MKITFKEVEIDLPLSELNQLPAHIRKRCLEHIAKEADIEALNKEIAGLNTSIEKKRGGWPKGKPRKGGPPEGA